MFTVKFIACVGLFLASSISFAENQYSISISADKMSVQSQQMGTDIAFSAVEAIGYVDNNSELNTLQRIGLVYGTHMISSVNHHIVGMGFRAAEFDGNISNIKVTPFGITANVELSAPYHLQKAALVALGGNEAGYILSQKIAKQWIMTNSDIDPITGLGYVFSYGDQFRYAYFDKGLKNPELSSYSYYMELLYGKGSMKPEKVRKEILLDIFDPLLLTSAYSGITGETMSLPVLNIGSEFGFMPFLRAVPTPYGVIQKKIGAYIITDYTPIKFSFSCGRQSKKLNIITIKTTSKNKEEASYTLYKDLYTDNLDTKSTATLKNDNYKEGTVYGHYDESNNDEFNNDFYQNYFNYDDYYEDSKSVISDKSLSTRSTTKSETQNQVLLEVIRSVTNEVTILQQEAKSYDVYIIECSVYKLYTTDNLNIGLDFAFWNQPKLFTVESYKEKPRFGFMINFNSAYSIKNNLDLTFDAGYKTNGFLPGYFIDKGIIFTAGLRWQL